MKGVLFPGERQVTLADVPEPQAGPGEVVVRVRASGMCGSDLHVYRSANGSAQPVIQGHEPCGEVHAVGSGVGADIATVGDRVMIHHYWGCGACEECRAGWSQLCHSPTTFVPSNNVHGGHAPLMVVAASTLIPMPEGLSFKAGAAIGCGTGTAWGGLQRLGGVGGAELVVFGQGPVGASATMLATAMGARVIAVDISPARLADAERFGAWQTIDSTRTDVVRAVQDLTGGRGPLLVLETSGASAAAQAAQDVLATWGKVCFLGLGADVTFNTMQTFRKQMTLMTSWTTSIVEQKRCADFVIEHGVPVDELFSHSWSLDDAEAAYRWFDQQSDGKGVFEF